MKLSNVALALFPASVVKVFAEDQAVIEWEALDESTGETTKDETVQAVEWAYSDATATKQVVDIGVLNVYEDPVTIYKGGVRAEMVPPNTAQGVAVNSHGYSHVSSFQHSGSSFQSGSSFLYGKSGKASGQCLAKYADCSTADDRCCFGYACDDRATNGDYECEYCGISNERCLKNDNCCEGYVCPYGNDLGFDPKYCVAAAHGGSSKSGKSSQPPTYQTCDFDDDCEVGSVCAVFDYTFNPTVVITKYCVSIGSSVGSSKSAKSSGASYCAGENQACKRSHDCCPGLQCNGPIWETDNVCVPILGR